MEQYLNIVDEHDNIIGQKTREDIHKYNWLHREINVYFITPTKELIFQHRAKNKDMYPDLLDATVGGHVEIGDNYEQTAIKEIFEETGLKINASDLLLIGKKRMSADDAITKNHNNIFSSRYLYIYRGDINDLKVEAGKALGFEAWPINKLLELNQQEKSKFIPYILDFISTDLINFIKNISL